MGHVNVRATIANPTDNSLAEQVDAMVDTGATFTCVPRSLAEQLRLPITGKDRARTATDDVVYDRSRALIQIDGQGEINRIIISDTLEKVLIGVFTLESLSLMVDPTTGQLKEAEVFLLLAMEADHD
jgi:aspartyl protease family protein